MVILCGCGQQKDESFEHNDAIIKKNDDGKDYVYFEDFNTYNLKNEDVIKQRLPIINGNTKDANNVNLELKNKVNYNLKKAVYENDVVSRLNYSEYISYESDDYFSLIDIDYQFYDGEKSLVNFRVYNFVKNKIELVDNQVILDKYDMNEDKLFDKVLSNMNINNPEYSLMMLKSDGYSLTVNNDNKLVIVYIEANDDDLQIKNMVIS